MAVYQLPLVIQKWVRIIIGKDLWMCINFPSLQKWAGIIKSNSIFMPVYQLPFLYTKILNLIQQYLSDLQKIFVYQNLN